MRLTDINLALSVIIILSISITGTEGVLRCYKCLSTSPSYYTPEPFHLCEDFDYSEKFIVDCPLSTLCVTRITSANILGPINGTERDCASQSQEIQIYDGKKYHREDLIEQPYEPGCSKLDDKGIRTSTTENCYCNSDLCNSSRTFRQSVILCAIFTVITFIYQNYLYNTCN